MADHASAGTLILDRYVVSGSRAPRWIRPGALLAVDQRLGCPVDVVIAPAPADTRAGVLFAWRAQILAALQHPALPMVLDVGVQDGYTVLVCQHADGYSLAENLGRAGAAWTTTRALQVISDLAAALGLAHVHGLCHGALTAHSVVVSPAGQATLVDLAWPHAATDPRDVAPELRAGRSPSPRGDVFALGRLLEALLNAGAAGPQRTADARLHGLLRRATSPYPDERYATATELTHAIAALLAVPDTLQPSRNVPATPTTRAVPAVPMARNVPAVAPARAVRAARAAPPSVPARPRAAVRHGGMSGLAPAIVLGLSLLLAPLVAHSIFLLSAPDSGFRIHHGWWGEPRHMYWQGGPFAPGSGASPSMRPWGWGQSGDGPDHPAPGFGQ